MSLSAPLKQLRGIARELRLAKVGKVQGTQGMQYTIQQFRSNEETTELLCKHKEEMQYIADTYQTYLESQRNYAALNEEYWATGERTVAATAKMVGFNLPHEPKILRKMKPKKEKEET